MTRSEKGRSIHSKAEQAREKGDFLKALQFIDEAMMVYGEDGDDLGFAEVFASRFLTLRHLFEKTQDKKFSILAKHSAMSSVEIAEESGDKSATALPLFNLAKVQEDLGEYVNAVGSYKRALEVMSSNPPTDHDRPAVIADMKAHMSVAEYKSGDKTALERLDEAITELEGSDELKYNKDVWLSGAHMRAAEILREDDVETAKGHLQKAKSVIDANPELTLRKEQWEKLAGSFK